jgi:SHAQKYF class myb-like DNA-binding protein
MADEGKLSDDDHFDEDDDGDEGGAGRNQGRWSREEHSAFMEGLRLHGREWKKIAAMIPSRTVVQIRTHAQKFFQKQAKSEGRASDDLGRGEKKRLKVSAPRVTRSGSVNESGPGDVNRDAKDVSAAAGGITPRTVAAATILLAPRFQQGREATPYTSEWMARHSASAAAVLETQKSRRTSPRLAPHLPPPQWPGKQTLDGESSGRPTPSPPLAGTESSSITRGRLASSGNIAEPQAQGSGAT